MRRLLILSFVAVAVLSLVPGWSGEARLALLDARYPNMRAVPVLLDAADPAKRRVGALDYLGGVALTSRDPAFGGFSALAVAGDRITMLSDGGNVVRFRIDARMQPHGVRFANLAAGPGTGWDKRDRDSESLAIDPISGTAWVGFENANMIWRYAPGFARTEAAAAPAAMAHWPRNGGPETMARLPDGRFVVMSETGRLPSEDWHGGEAARRHTRAALLFAGDPADPRAHPARFAYMPAPHHDPSDAAALPNGDVLVLDRRFRLPYRFSATISRVKAGQIRPGALVRPERLAVLDSPLVHDNYEGVAVSQEGADTIVWIISDDNQSLLQRTLLLKFRLRR